VGFLGRFDGLEVTLIREAGGCNIGGGWESTAGAGGRVEFTSKD